MAALMGRLDVDAMLDELTPEQFNEWAAAWNVGLFRDEWLQAGTVAAEIHNGFCDIRAGLGDKSITQDSYRYPTDYDPTRDQTKKKRKVDRENINAAQRRLEAIYGAGRKNRPDSGQH